MASRFLHPLVIGQGVTGSVCRKGELRWWEEKNILGLGMLAPELDDYLSLQPYASIPHRSRFQEKISLTQGLVCWVLPRNSIPVGISWLILSQNYLWNTNAKKLELIEHGPSNECCEIWWDPITFFFFLRHWLKVSFKSHLHRFS